jgi:hypothetical protein
MAAGQHPCHTSGVLLSTNGYPTYQDLGRRQGLQPSLRNRAKGVDSATMESITRLDRVSVFGGKLSFLIPHDWIEEVEGDNYLYTRPGSDSGWLRVSLITCKPIDETPLQRLERVFGSRDGFGLDARTGNRVCNSEKDSEEEGAQIHHFYWKVANIVVPDLVYEALFSYTILRERVNEEETRQTVKLIGQCSSQAAFSPGERLSG